MISQKGDHVTIWKTYCRVIISFKLPDWRCVLSCEKTKIFQISLETLNRMAILTPWGREIPQVVFEECHIVRTKSMFDRWKEFSREHFSRAKWHYSLNRSTGVFVINHLNSSESYTKIKTDFLLFVARHSAAWILTGGEGSPAGRPARKPQVQSLLWVCFESKLWILCAGTRIIFLDWSLFLKFM